MFNLHQVVHSISLAFTLYWRGNSHEAEKTAIAFGEQ